MKSCTFLVAAFILATTSRISVGNEASTAVSIERLSEIEAELAEIQDWQQQWTSHGMPEHGSEYRPYVEVPDSRMCAARRGFYAGAELLLIKPHFENQILTRIESSGGFTERGTDMNYDYSAAPRFWLGYALPGGWGIQTSYWSLDQTSNLAETIVGGETALTEFTAGGRSFNAGLAVSPNVGPQEITLRHKLEIEVLDGQMTYQSQCRHFTWESGFGIRYARVDQSARAFLGTLNLFEHYFEGVGPVGNLAIRRDVGRGFELDGRLAGCVLFGDQAASFQRPLEDYREFSPNGLLSIGEVSLGVRKTWDSRWGEFYSRAGWEGQIWFGAGNAVSTRADLALQGFTLALGLRR